MIARIDAAPDPNVRADALNVIDGTVRLRLAGSCRGCSSSTMTLKLAIERAIYEAGSEAPEVVTGGQIALKEPAAAHGLVQLEGVSNNGGYDQCVSVKPSKRDFPQVRVKGETHG